MSVCACPSCSWYLETRGGCWILWNWSPMWLCYVGSGNWTCPLQEQVLLTAWLSLRPPTKSVRWNDCSCPFSILQLDYFPFESSRYYAVDWVCTKMSICISKPDFSAVMLQFKSPPKLMLTLNWHCKSLRGRAFRAGLCMKAPSSQMGLYYYHESRLVSQ